MDKLLTSGEVADLLRIEQQTLQVWCNERRFPFVKMSRRDYRFRSADVQAWLEGRFVPVTEHQEQNCTT
jgi:excisionase family DNA binding protein